MRIQNQKIGQKGAAALEFALVLPLLVLLTFGIIEFSLLLYNKAMLTNASREGARAGIVFSDPRADDAYIKTKVEAYCSTYLITFGSGSGIPLSDDDIDITPIESNRLDTDVSPPGTPMTVTVRYHYDFLVLPNIPLGPIGLKDGITLRAVTVMRME